MTHDPSANQTIKAIQIDIDGASAVSDDITVHTKTDFQSKNIYFIDQRYFVTSSSSTSGMILYARMTGFSFMGGVTRCNAITGLATITDNRFCGVNSRGVTLTNIETASGADPITTQSIKSFWRVL